MSQDNYESDNRKQLQIGNSGHKYIVARKSIDNKQDQQRKQKKQLRRAEPDQMVSQNTCEEQKSGKKGQVIGGSSPVQPGDRGK